jgi:queuine tRNA-ribosyltransferase
MLAPILGTLHNLWYYQQLMAGMRAAIAAGTFDDFRRSFHAARAGDGPGAAGPAAAPVA